MFAPSQCFDVALGGIQEDMQKIGSYRGGERREKQLCYIRSYWGEDS